MGKLGRLRPPKMAACHPSWRTNWRALIYFGIIVFRLVSQGHASVIRAVGRILPMLASEPLVGRLWIVDEHQVRIRSAGPASTP
jgi:hypothetical protein